MARMQNGYMREDSGALQVIDTAAKTDPTTIGRAFVWRDAVLRVVSTTAAVGSYPYMGGFPLSGTMLSVVPFATLTGPTKRVGSFLVDANNQLVTVTVALSVGPLLFVNGFQRDANGALVVT